MTDTIENRLKNLGISIPQAAAPAANYVPFAQSDSLLLTSGQLPLENCKLVHTGLIGKELTVADGQAAARAVQSTFLPRQRRRSANSIASSGL